MKNSIPTSPRFVCQVVRSARALFESAGSGHVATCADCQVHYRAADHLELELRREASALRRADPVPSPDLERSILRAVREERAAARPALVRSRTPLWATGALAAAAVAVVIFFQRPGSASLPLPGQVTADAAAVMDALGNFSTKLTDTVIPATGAMVANNPLQRELGSAYADARSALNFLALNFLPAGERSSAAKEPAAI